MLSCEHWPLAPGEQAGGIYVDDGKGNLAIPLSYPTLEDNYDVIREVVSAAQKIYYL